MDVSLAKANMREGPLGFYMSNDQEAAIFYANAAKNYATLVKYNISIGAYSALIAAGAESGMTGQAGRNSVIFHEFIIRPAEFPLFNTLLLGREINSTVRLMSDAN